MSSLSRKYIAFHNGNLIEGDVLANIVSAAKRGKITEAGKSLLLMLDPRYGPKDSSGLRAMRRVRKSDCIALTSFCPHGKRTKPTPARTETLKNTRSKASVNAASRRQKRRTGPMVLDRRSAAESGAE